jgi:TetR/AcrR family transcriptional repressor of nem operon
MARAIEFDYEKALHGATWLFWKNGYSGTSLRALLKVMGIGEGSFYNSLKSKKHLYLECLKHYNMTVGVKRGTALISAPTASMGIRALFGLVLDCLDDPTTPSPICMMAGSLSGDVLAEPDLRKFVQSELSTFGERLTGRLAADKEAGNLPADFDPKIIAQVIITYMQGLWRMALVSYSRPKFEKQIDVFLRELGL